ncbi:MAG: hypothetical protein EB122_01245, partial [Actinobacteria bacterium]|nr:hypothetical protein [Actinomycetota bacterium]
GSEIVIVSIKGITGATGPQGPIGPTGGPTGATGPISPAGGIRWAYTSDGFSTIYAIPGAFSTLNTAYLVTYNGVTQDPANYTITAGSPYSITLSTSPAAGVGIVIVSLNGIQGATGATGPSNVQVGEISYTSALVGNAGVSLASTNFATLEAGKSYLFDVLVWGKTSSSSLDLALAVSAMGQAPTITTHWISTNSRNYRGNTGQRELSFLEE